MKKLLFAVCAFAALTACNRDEAIVSAPKQAINFNSPFINNSTRSAIDGTYSGTKELRSFTVYGTVTGNGNTLNIFNGVPVVGTVGDDVWGYEDKYTQYWVPSCSYNFAAVADATSVELDGNGMPKSITFNDNTTEQGDLLYAEATATTDATAVPSGVTAAGAVPFTFDHLLAKAQFTFQNTITNNSRYTFNVKNIKFKDVKKQGTYDVSAETWKNQTIEGELNFGNSESAIANGASAESNNARTFVPAPYTDSDPLTVEFTVEMLLDGTAISSVTHTKSVAREFSKGQAYNFIVKLGAGNKITFTVEEVAGWDEKIDITIP